MKMQGNRREASLDEAKNEACARGTRRNFKKKKKTPKKKKQFPFGEASVKISVIRHRGKRDVDQGKGPLEGKGHEGRRRKGGPSRWQKRRRKSREKVIPQEKKGSIWKKGQASLGAGECGKASSFIRGCEGTGPEGTPTISYGGKAQGRLFSTKNSCG